MDQARFKSPSTPVRDGDEYSLQSGGREDRFPCPNFGRCNQQQAPDPPAPPNFPAHHRQPPKPRRREEEVLGNRGRGETNCNNKAQAIYYEMTEQEFAKYQLISKKYYCRQLIQKKRRSTQTCLMAMYRSEIPLINKLCTIRI